MTNKCSGLYLILYFRLSMISLQEAASLHIFVNMLSLGCFILPNCLLLPTACCCRACVRFRFLQRPEYVTAGTRFVFREGRTKGIGVVVGTEHDGPLAAPQMTATQDVANTTAATSTDGGSSSAAGTAAAAASADGVVSGAAAVNGTCAASAAAGRPKHTQRKDQAVGR